MVAATTRPLRTVNTNHVKSYEDQVLRGVDLMSFDLDAKAIVTEPLKPNMEPPALEFPR